MRSGKKLLCLAVCVVAMSFAAAGSAQAADDWQYWNGVKLKHALHEKLDAHIKFGQRVTDDLGELGLHNYAPGIVYKPNKHLQYAIGYKYELSKGASRWSQEHRLEQILTLEGSWIGFKGGVGTRFEYRSIDGSEKWRWREKLKISLPMAIGQISFSPYVSEEFFYDFLIDEYNQNRAVVGITKKIASDIEVDLYYMYKANLKSAGWSGVNIFGSRHRNNCGRADNSYIKNLLFLKNSVGARDAILQYRADGFHGIFLSEYKCLK